MLSVLSAVAFSALSALSASSQPPQAAQAAARASAPIDLTGYWVSIVTEDWRYRMMTPRKGDYASVPLNAAARKAADAWDPAADAASGNACRSYGVGNIMRVAGRVHITWQDDETLKIESDAGTQTRLLHFAEAAQPPAGDGGWQGFSVARWQLAGPQRRGGPAAGRGRGGPPKSGSLKVVTMHMKAGYLRKNGVPYSEKATVTEYFDRHTEPNGDQWFTVTTVIDDPTYLDDAFITSSSFKKEPDGAKWHATPCTAE
ncbi:MAG TPA: hypothetical protein VKE51_42750 [Vicinamibacterales bacterium]|nr:hypothetical protein [Vicinamibacterales bacterium]